MQEKRELQVIKPSIYFSAIEARNKVIEMSIGGNANLQHHQKPPKVIKVLTDEG